MLLFTPMSMLTKQDLNQIGGLIRDSENRLEKKLEKKFDTKLEEKLTKFEDRIVGRIVADVGEMIEQNVLPQIAEVREDVAIIKATMVTKDHLRLAALEP